MSRDFRYRTEPHRNRWPSVWPPFTVGLLIGALGVGAAWVKYGSGDGGKLVEPCRDAKATRPAIADEDAAVAPKPVFDYPQILPAMEVVVPDEPAGRGIQPPPPPKEVSKEVVESRPLPSGGEVLMIQVAALKTLADAERLKARLAVSGLQAQIEPAKINGTAVYRVRLGPFGRKEALEAPRRALTDAGYSSIVVQLK